MKKIVAIFLCLTLLMGLAACGSSTQETIETTQATEPAVTNTYYTLYAMEYGDVLIEADEMQDMLMSQGWPADDMYILLRSDGTGHLYLMSDDLEILYDDAAYWPAEDPDARVEYTLEGNILTVHISETTYIFEH